MSTFTLKVFLDSFSVGSTACSEQGERFLVSSGSLGWRLQKGGSVEGRTAAWCQTPAKENSVLLTGTSLCFIHVGFSHVGFRYIRAGRTASLPRVLSHSSSACLRSTQRVPDAC